MKPKILIVDDDQGQLDSFFLALRKHVDSQQIVAITSYNEALDIFKENPFSFAAAFVDYQLLENGQEKPLGHLLVKEFKKINECLMTVIISGDKEEEALQNWLGCEVDKFFYKPVKAEMIQEIAIYAIEKYKQIFKSQDNISYELLPEQKKVGLIGISDNIKNVCKSTIKFSKFDEHVLILGETGTGKELVAKAIHDNSNRANGPFVAINCAAIAPTLFESELFGHVQGAFTGAKESKLGKFREANRGTIFLDEIHQMPLDQQVKLLRVLQEKQVTPVGGGTSICVDFRLVVASKPNLKDLSTKGKFLPDLYYRIICLDITIKPLRERPEDVLPTIQYFQQIIEKRTGQKKRIMKSTLEKISSYSWPGNVRELKSVIDKLYVNVAQGLIRSSHLPKHILEESSFSFYKSNSDDLISMEEFEAQYKRDQMDLITKALVLSNDNTSQAAILLKMKLNTLKSRMKAFGMKGKNSKLRNALLSKFSKIQKETFI